MKTTASDKQEQELQAIVDEIEVDIQNGDYDAALIKANGLYYTKDWSSDIEKKWDNTREGLIELIEEKKNQKSNTENSNTDSVSLDNLPNLEYDVKLHWGNKNGSRVYMFDYDTETYVYYSTAKGKETRWLSYGKCSGRIDTMLSSLHDDGSMYKNFVADSSGKYAYQTDDKGENPDTLYKYSISRPTTDNYEINKIIKCMKEDGKDF